MRTAHGKTRAIEVNVGARYGTNQKVTHLRCHLTDVTDKVRAERELRLRTRELTQVNEQLRQINRELEELKDRYTDLYENAPAMYFSLDVAGDVIECNQTMLVDPEPGPRPDRRPPVREHCSPSRSGRRFQARFQEFLADRLGARRRPRWVKSGGELIDVWILGTVDHGFQGFGHHARFVAQDVTAKRRLEAELQEKNQRLAETNDELSQKNRELDEFVYVVSHDLQEPLRTLIAFSDFLLKDYGDRLEAEGQEYRALPGRRLPPDAGHDSWDAESLAGRQGDRRLRGGRSGRPDRGHQDRPGRAVPEQEGGAADRRARCRRSGATETESASYWPI